MARLFDRRVAETGGAEGDNHQPTLGIFAKEWRSLQRERCRHRILRCGTASEWGASAAGHHDRRRSAVPPGAVYREFAIQEGGGRFEMGSHALYHKMSAFVRIFIAVCLCLLAYRTAAA